MLSPILLIDQSASWDSSTFSEAYLAEEAEIWSAGEDVLIFACPNWNQWETRQEDERSREPRRRYHRIERWIRSRLNCQGSRNSFHRNHQRCSRFDWRKRHPKCLVLLYRLVMCRRGWVLHRSPRRCPIAGCFVTSTLSVHVDLIDASLSESGGLRWMISSRERLPWKKWIMTILVVQFTW